MLPDLCRGIQRRRRRRRFCSVFPGAVTPITTIRSPPPPLTSAARVAKAPVSASRYFGTCASRPRPGARGPGAWLVPGEGLKVVAHVLLVEAWLGLPPARNTPRPETRRVGRQGLVDPQQHPVSHAELELGVRQDDSACLGVSGARGRRWPGSCRGLPPLSPCSDAPLPSSANGMFSSCPDSALVAGVKRGWSSRSDSLSPDGSGMPHTEPVAL